MNKYLYSLSIAFVFCCSSVSLKAQTLTIGTGTTTTRAPFGSYYGYEYNAYIYTSPFLSGVSGAIVQIGFNVGAGTTLSQIPVTIKMKARALSDSSMTSQSYSTVSAGAKTVFQGVIGTGNLVTAGNYMLINLTDTFKLPASQNLMIFVENAYGNNGGWDSTTTLFRYTATTGNKAIKWFSDGAPPTANGDPNTKRPNTRIVFSNSNCAGTPTPGLTIHSFGTTNPACPGSTFTLSLGQSGTIFTPAQNTTYQWQSSSDGTNYSNIALATKPTLNTSQTSNTYYRCVVTCPTSASTATSTAVLVNTNVNGCYCVPVYQEGCNFGDEINGVQLNNLDKTDQNPNCTGGTAAYTYFSTDTAKLVKNGTQTLFIYLGSDLNNYAGAWIDYNTNGVYETSEFLGASGNVGQDGKAMISFTVPGTAVTGNTRMRIRGGSDVAITSGQSCGHTSSTAGESEDYNVLIQNTSNCNSGLSAGTAIANYTSVCSGYSVSIALNGHSTETGITYQWQDSSAGSPSFADMAGFTNPYFSTPPITQTKYYRCKVTCTLSGTTVYSNVLTINLSPPASGGTVTGTLVAAPGTNNVTLIVSNYVGNVQWQLSFSPNGFFSDVSGGIEDTLILSLSNPGVYYFRNKANVPGCSFAYSNVITVIIANFMDDACNPQALIFGTNGPYSNTTATVQTSEVAPPGGGCNTQSNWCAADAAVQKSLWFSFVAPTSGRVEVKALGFNTQLAIWRTDTCNSFTSYTLISANDDGGGSPNLGAIDTATCLTPGRTYLVQLDGYLGATGSTSIILTALPTIPFSLSACPSNVSVNTTNGLCTGTATWTPPVASPNCPNISITSNYSPGAAFPVGTTTVTYTATDNVSSTQSCSFTVTVTDNQAPSINCPANVTVNTNSGQCFATGVSLGTPVTSDNCSVLSTSNNGLSQYNVGNTNVTWTVTDNHSLTNSCVQIVTVVDNQLPTITCPANVTSGTNPGQCFATGVVLGTPTSSDNCGISGTVNNAPTQFNSGNTSVIWTVTDVNGNTKTCSQNVLVIENQPPTISCPATATANTNLNQCFATGVALGSPTTSDNCGIASTVNNAPTQFSTGNTTVTWTVTDNAGNTASCNQTVTVTDNQNPSISCPATATANANSGQCFATGVVLGSPTTSDNCGISGTTNNGSASYNVGNTSVTWTTTDVNGRTASCVQTVTVVDNQNPVISCPSTVTVNANTGSCVATGVTLGTPVTSDNCGISTTVNNSSGTYNLGNNSVTWTTTDVNGRTSSCVQTVTVIDNQPPTISCPSTVTVNSNGSVSGSVTITPSKDNSIYGGFVNNSNGAGEYIYVGNDGQNRKHRALVNFNIAANVPAGATITSATLTMFMNQTVGSIEPVSLHKLTQDWGEGTSNAGNNGGPGAAATTNDATWNHRFYNIALWTTAGGVFNASASATQNIDQQGSYSWSSAGMITDVQSWLNSPGLNFGWLIKTDENNSFEAKEFGSRNNLNSLIRPTLQINYTIPAQCYATNVALGTPTATDNCGSVSTSNNGPSQYPVGNTIVIWTATDNGGNTATCNQTVTVIDNILPTITCPTNITVNPNPGTCIATGVSLGSVTTSDNCGIATTLNNAPTQYGGGVTTVTWTTTDVNGNTASCSQTVTLLDNTPPTITCPSNKTVNMNTGLCVATGVSLGVPVTNDNCGILSTTNNAPTQFTLGSTTVIWTTSDNSGNTASCSQTVTVIDNQLPTITCPAAISVQCSISEAPAYLNLSAFLNAGGSVSDNCGINTASFSLISQVSNNGSCPEIIMRTYLISDVNGNTSTCNQVISVHDLINPVAQCQNISVTLDNSGSAIVTAAMINNGSSDNCGIANMSVSPSSFNCNNIGLNQVVFTVTDNCGNTATCTATVTVNSNIVVSTTSVNVSCGSGLGQATASATGGTSPYSYLWNNGSTTATATGLVTGTYTVTVFDNNGCTSTATAVVTVTPPVSVNCTSVNNICFGGTSGSVSSFATGGSQPYSYLWSNGAAVATVNNLPAGTYTIVVTDNSGCTSSCSTVISQPSPTIITGTTTIVKCKNGNDGSIDITASGTPGPYTYLWNNGVTSEDPSNLAAGTYVVTVTNSLGCTRTATFVVSQPATLLTVSISKTNVRCGGKATGSASVAATGGVPGYSYQWSNGFTTTSISGLIAGTYTVTVTDSNGCIKSKSFAITQNPTLVVVIVPTGPSQATANVSGGIPGYTYFWNTSPAQTTAVATGLIAGNIYKVKVNDTKGCSKTATILMPTPKASENNVPLSLNVYPNPASEILHIRIDNLTDKGCSMRLMDNLGKIVYVSDITTTSSFYEHDLLVAGLPKGIYTLLIASGKQNKFVKVAIE